MSGSGTRRLHLSPEQRRYLAIAQGVVPFVVNFFLNGAIAWATFRGLGAVPVWRLENSAGPDLLGTLFFLPAITCIIVTPLVRRDVARGAIAPLGDPRRLPALLAYVHAGLWRRAAALGGLTLVSLGPIVVLALIAAGVEAFPLGTFLWLKALFAGLLGAVVTPAIGLLALADPAPARAS